MNNLKRYQICHDLITYFATLISPKKKSMSFIFITGGSMNESILPDDELETQ